MTFRLPCHAHRSAVRTAAGTSFAVRKSIAGASACENTIPKQFPLQSWGVNGSL